MSPRTRIDTLLRYGAFSLLVAAFVTGGDSIHRDWGDVVMQCLAVPVFALAACALLRPPSPQQHWLLIAVALLPPGVVALQLLAGTTATPWATERALLAWIPPVAAFLAGLALSPSTQRDGLMLLVVLVLAHMGFAIVQLGVPQDSVLNPYPQRAPRFNGLFANVNHHATALAIAAVLLLSRTLQQRRSVEGKLATGIGIGLCLLLLVALPLTGSRGMFLIAAVAILGVPVANGWLARQWRGRGKARFALLAVPGLVVLALAGLSALGWMRVDREQESRAELATATAKLAMDAMPLGTGAGSFVRWFEAHMPAHMLQGEYYNHAHNEYVQWWLEGGVAGLGWIAMLLAAFAWTFPRRDRDGHPPGWWWVGSWLGAGILLAHSVVDYPLRTPALATAGAWLAAVAVSSTLRSRSRDTASQPPPAQR